MGNFQEITSSIQNIENLGQLRQLGEVLQRQWKVVQSKACTEALKRIKIGATVTFYSKGGVLVKAKVVKVCSKTIKVHSVSGQSWTVSPTKVTVVSK